MVLSFACGWWPIYLSEQKLLLAIHLPDLPPTAAAPARWCGEHWKEQQGKQSKARLMPDDAADQCTAVQPAEATLSCSYCWASFMNPIPVKCPIICRAVKCSIKCRAVPANESNAVAFLSGWASFVNPIPVYRRRLSNHVRCKLKANRWNLRNLDGI